MGGLAVAEIYYVGCMLRWRLFVEVIHGSAVSVSLPSGWLCWLAVPSYDRLG